MTPAQLGDLTVKEFFNKQIGWFEFMELQQQQEWERTRWLAAIVINPHTKKTIKPKDLCTFEWEKGSKGGRKQDLDKLYKEAKYMDKVWRKQKIVKNGE